MITIRSTRSHYPLPPVGRPGFTLLELLIVITIIVFVSLLLWPRYRDFKASNAVRNAAQLMAMDLKSMRQRAIATEKVYGIYIATTTRYRTCGGNDPGQPLSTTTSFKEVDLGKALGAVVLITTPAAYSTIAFDPRSTVPSTGTWAWTTPLLSGSRWTGGEILGFKSGRYSMKITITNDGQIVVPEQITRQKEGLTNENTNTATPSPTP